MIFYPSCGDLRTDLKLLQYPTQFHAHLKDSNQQQEFGQDEHPAWIDEQKWSFIEHQIYESLQINKMSSLPKMQVGDATLEKDFIWFPKQTESNPTFSNPFIQFIESNQDERNNNNVNHKSHLLNFSLKNSGYYQEEDEKENMGWIPNNNMSLNNMIIQSNSNQSPVKDGKSNLLNVCLNDEDSSSFDPYGQWKSKLSQWNNDNNANQLQDQKLELSSSIGLGGEDQDTDVEKEEEVVVVEEQEEEELNEEEEEDEQEEEKEDKSTSSMKTDEMDTLLTFLSKFDEKVAAIWGQKKEISETLRTNPWENERSDIRLAPASLFDYQQIEDETTIIENSTSGGAGERGEIDNPSTEGRKYTIMNSMKQYFGNAPPKNEYVIIHDEKTNSNLKLLNHSDERSGFIKFIPLYSDQKHAFKFSNFHKYQLEQKATWGATSLKEMLNNLELDGCDADEQEIVAACSQPLKSLDEGPTDDLLTSWKTHFRPVGAMETQELETEASSPATTLNHPQLPEFREAEFREEKDYVLYQRTSTTTAFQVRFKLCRENEKGNQTDEPVSCFSLNTRFDLGNFQQTPLITDYGDYESQQQLYGWLSGPFEEEPREGIEQFDWSNGRFMDSYVHNIYCEDAFDEYDSKTTNDNDSDYGQFQAAFCFTGGGGGSSNRNNKQSKANRRRAKGRPCKYFFMDGVCRRGNECKFSHDLITCRFWAEGGSCLKDPCPFLHCFLDAKDFDGHDSFSHKLLDTKYKLPPSEKKNFNLENESDFPALQQTFPALGSTKISSRVPISENGSKVMDIFDDEGNSNTLNKKSEDEGEEAGWPQQLTTNWICSLISTNEKRKEKK